jgi:hypothetical protein
MIDAVFMGIAYPGGAESLLDTHVQLQAEVAATLAAVGADFSRLAATIQLAGHGIAGILHVARIAFAVSPLTHVDLTFTMTGTGLVLAGSAGYHAAGAAGGYLVALVAGTQGFIIDDLALSMARADNSVTYIVFLLLGTARGNQAGRCQNAQ